MGKVLHDLVNINNSKLNEIFYLLPIDFRGNGSLNFNPSGSTCLTLAGFETKNVEAWEVFEERFVRNITILGNIKKWEDILEDGIYTQHVWGR